jgi:predicted nucleotidyltransferase component of viral defense system
MNLLENRETFRDFLALTAVSMGLDKRIDIIEKDYYVTYFLQKIADKQPYIVFKGGTSLSKCHKVINRFSEDIDLSLEPKTHRVTDAQRKSLKKDILTIIEESGFSLDNPQYVRSRQDINKYIVSFPMSNENKILNPKLIVETSVLVKCFPTEKKEVTSLIYDFLKSQNAVDDIERFGLKPFKIETQSLERTFADKLFAIADYYLDSKRTRLSRHIYDLYKLYPKIVFDDSFKELFTAVREVRKPIEDKCFSAQDGVDLPKILQEIVDTAYYYDDYKSTNDMFFDGEDVSYETAIIAVQNTIDNFFLLGKSLGE